MLKFLTFAQPGMNQLRSLDLSDTQVGNQGMSHLSQLKSLVRVFLYIVAVHCLCIGCWRNWLSAIRSWVQIPVAVKGSLAFHVCTRPASVAYWLSWCSLMDTCNHNFCGTSHISNRWTPWVCRLQHVSSYWKLLLRYLFCLCLASQPFRTDVP